MPRNILYFDEMDIASLSEVGGKGANLGELTKAGFPVPGGFCITASAYRSVLYENEKACGVADLFDLFSKLNPDEIERIREVGQQIRARMLALPIPQSLVLEILEAWRKLGEFKAYAVRSSATVEDLPGASFAGQLTSYLNIIGKKQIVESIRKCMASLFTERAISYRVKNGLVNRDIAVCVVVQEMVFPEVSGVMFTADPTNGNRRVISIDAGFGFGEAIVAGLTDVDLYRVKTAEQSTNQIIEKRIAQKKFALHPSPGGGTEKREISQEHQYEQVLSDNAILDLSQTGRKIEAHFGVPQDIEWAIAQGNLYIIQSRPITTLYSVPAHDNGKGLRIYFSFGHRQNMTDAIKPLGISLLRTFVPYGKNGKDSRESTMILPAGSRLYVDLTELLRFKYSYYIFIAPFKQVDEITANALSEVINRKEFLGNGRIELKHDLITILTFTKYILWLLTSAFLDVLFRDPRKAKNKIDRLTDSAVKAVAENMSILSGADRIRFIQKSSDSFFRSALNRTIHYAVAGIISQRFIEHYLKKWLGDSGSLQYLNRSLSGNITTDMGLEIGDLADIARGNQALIAYLRSANDAFFYEGLRSIEGGIEFADALSGFMQRYGMRCAGEVDITRVRWNEAPSHLMPILLSNVDTLAPGEHRLRFRQGKHEAEEATKNVIKGLRFKKGGFFKAKIMSRLITVFRKLMPLREHPKYILICQFDLYRKALMQEASLFIERGLMRTLDDIYYFSLSEIIEMIEGRFAGNVSEIARKRKAEFIRDESLKPPRLITSDGEIISGLRDRGNVPFGSLIGLPVSGGIVEGRARVVFKPEQADLEPGDILVAPHTDPAWTSLFLSARGVVTQAGGLMTHGAVIAREYGIPAVAGVDRATELIKNGQRIRVNGNLGYVEVV